MTQLLSSRKVSAMQMSEYYIQDGATVMPVDDYVIWLQCAGLDNPYGSLANVIADTTAMETLCNNLNALRYMVRSEDVIMSAVMANSDWVLALDSSAYSIKVPTMTSDTTPSGITKFAVNNTSRTDAYKMFNTADQFVVWPVSFPFVVYADLGQETFVYRAEYKDLITNSSTRKAIQYCKLTVVGCDFASNTLGDWTALSSQITVRGNGTIYTFPILSNNGSYRYIGVTIPETWYTDNTAVTSWWTQFYGLALY